MVEEVPGLRGESWELDIRSPNTLRAVACERSTVTAGKHCGAIGTAYSDSTLDPMETTEHLGHKNAACCSTSHLVDNRYYS